MHTYVIETDRRQQTVQADGYDVEHGLLTFLDAAGGMVACVPASAVLEIRRQEEVLPVDRERLENLHRQLSARLEGEEELDEASIGELNGTRALASDLLEGRFSPGSDVSAGEEEAIEVEAEAEEVAAETEPEEEA